MSNLRTVRHDKFGIYLTHEGRVYRPAPAIQEHFPNNNLMNMIDLGTTTLKRIEHEAFQGDQLRQLFAEDLESYKARQQHLENISDDATPSTVLTGQRLKVQTNQPYPFIGINKETWVTSPDDPANQHRLP